MSAGFRSSTASKTYSLLVNLGRSTKCIVEITILSSGLVDAVQLTLEVPRRDHACVSESFSSLFRIDNSLS